MPLVVMVGIPCSGKSRRVQELIKFLSSKSVSCKTTIIEDCHFSTSHKSDVFVDSRLEKELRSNIKSTVQRTLSKEHVVIIDSLNYIKGFRYEIYCVAKSIQTPQCVIYCATLPQLAAIWNDARADHDRYSLKVFNELVMRFESPDSRNRWDSPLFIVTPDDVFPGEQIYDALFKQKAPPPNLSTLSQPLSSTSFLHELDKITKTVIDTIVFEQKTWLPGDLICIADCSEKVTLPRLLTFSELQRQRRQFISFTKSHPVDETSKIAGMFIQFINNCVS